MIRNLRFVIISFLVIISIVGSAQTFNGTSGQVSDDGQINYFDVTVSGLIQNIDTSFGITTSCIDILHTWDDDLVVYLKSPGNTLVELTSHNGGADDNYSSTCFNMDAASSIMSGQAPFTGDFIPEGNLGDFNNEQDGNGLWQLVIIDEYPYADQGFVLSWSVTFGSNAPSPTPIPDISSNLPLITINTNGQIINDITRITAQMGIIDNGPNPNHLTDSFNEYDGYIAIEKRGSTSLLFPQAPYTFETQDSAGNNNNIGLLGFPVDNDWILYAPYNDKSLMRNALIYHLSNKIGRYAVRTKYCELFINNQYQGIYILMEKIKVDDDRVNINELLPTDIYGDARTGGYILKVDKFDGEQVDYFVSDYPPCADTSVWQTINFQYHDPQPEEIVGLQKVYIQSYVDSFEDALAGNNFQDETSGFRKYADEYSFIDHSLLNELAKNVDAYRWSAYLYKERNSDGGKMYAGPIWDFNISMGNADYYNGAPPGGWQWDFPCPFGDGGLNPFWWKRLLQDSVYYQNLKCRWQELRQTFFSEAYIDAHIDSLVALVDSAKERHFAKWPILGVYVWPNAYVPSTYEEEIDTLKNWLHARMVWIDDQLQTECLTGIENNPDAVESGITLSPNPATTLCMVELHSTHPDECMIEIHDLQGRKIRSLTGIHLHTGPNKISISLDEIRDGVYLVEVKSAQMKKVLPLCVMR